MKIFVVFVASLMLVASITPSSISSESKALVRFENGRLSVKARNVPLKEILSEIQETSGIVIELKDPKAGERRSVVDFEDLLPARAFRAILQDSNFAFFYAGTRLARVLILSSGNQIPESRSGSKKPNRSPQQFRAARNAPMDSRATPKPPEKNSRDSRVMSKLEAIEALEDSEDPKSIAALGDSLTDQDHEVKEAALRVLADKNGADVMQMLRRGLNDADPEFRIEVLEALADRGDLDSLRKALADRNQDVRETAADLLKRARPQSKSNSNR